MEEKINVKEAVDELVSCKDLAKELSLLKVMTYQLFENSPSSANDGFFEEESEADFLLTASKCQESISQSIDTFFSGNQETINKFVQYVFMKRYGWSEKQSSPKRDLLADKAGECKEDMNKLLDKLVKWFKQHHSLSDYLLQAFVCTASNVSDYPVVRSQLIFCALDWLVSLAVRKLELPDQCYFNTKKIILHGVTDVWSAIRSNSASKLADVTELFNHDQLKDLFLCLVQLCKDVKKPWQAHDGAIRGILMLLRSCKWTASTDLIETSDVSSSIYVKFGRCSYPSWPAYVISSLESTIFSLFAHEQLGVRESASKAFAALLMKCTSQYCLDAFKKLIDHLAEEAMTQPNGDMNFMNDYEAEGFLDAVILLMKKIPISAMLENWQILFSVFSHYLMHPASTVRQAASMAFKSIVTKEQTSAALLKLVLQSLAASWYADTKMLNIPLHTRSVKHLLQRHGIKSYRQGTEMPINEVWEWREGRLLAYELILRFLITNHVYYTFTSQQLKTSEPRLQFSLGSANSRDLFKEKSLDSSTKRRPLSKSLRTKSFTTYKEKASYKVDDTNKIDYLSSFHSNRRSMQVISEIQSLLQSVRQEIEQSNSKDLVKDIKSSIDIPSFTYSSETLLKRSFLVTDTNQGDVSYLRNQPLESFGCIIIQVLWQTIESLNDSRWELRRMGQQILPFVSEVIRYYNFDVLESLLREHLSKERSILSFGACHCLRDTIIHIEKLKNQSQSWSDSPEGRRTFEELFRRTEIVIRDVTSSLVAVLNTAHADRFTNICAEILILRRIHVPQEPFYDAEVSRYFQQLAPCAQDKRDKLDNLAECSSINELKDNFKNNLTAQRYSQVLENLICQCQPHLKDYCRLATIENLLLLVPIFLKLVHKTDYSVDSNLLLNCCDIILNRLKTMCIVKTIVSLSLESLREACHELCWIIQQRELDLHFTRQALSFALTLQSLLGQHFPTDLFITSVSSRLENENQKNRISGTSEDERYLYIQLLSNDIRCSPIEPMRSLSVDEDDQTDNDEALTESFAMMSSHGSSCSSLKSMHLQRSMGQDVVGSDCAVELSEEEDEGLSDWDSWSEEEEVSPDTKKLLQSFLDEFRKSKDLASVTN